MLSTCTPRLFAIYLLRFQQYYISLDAFLNKVFGLKQKNSNISQRSMNLSSRFERKNQSLKENENAKNKMRKSVKNLKN